MVSGSVCQLELTYFHESKTLTIYSGHFDDLKWSCRVAEIGDQSELKY